MSKSKSNPDHDDRQVPYRDADPEHGEIPLDELDTFLIRATDEKGSSVRLSFNMPPLLERDIQIVIRSGRFPYLRDGDFLRHASVRHLNWLSSIRESIPKAMIPALDLMSEACRDDELRTRTEETLARIEQRIAHHLSRNDYMEVVRLVNLLKSKLDHVDVSSSWRRDFATEFNTRYVQFLNIGNHKEVLGAGAHKKEKG